jgi:O-antigen ligase
MSTITESWEGGNAHNVFLRFWIGCGFLGLLVVSVFFCIVLQRCFYIENNGKLPSDFVIGRGFSCGFLLLLIMGQFNGISTMFLFYALPGFVGVWYHQLSGRLKVTRS